MKMISLFIRY